MADRDDDMPLGEKLSIDPTREVDELFDELTTLLKNPDVVGALSERGINASLALLAVDGTRAYLAGDKAQAADDLRTVAEEIEGRLKFGNDPPSA
ncbi:MAG: hypothetical protein JNL21_21880 [Myxococcales bacterium]|nr:hypothetical protein [Myxococcales bacterium]